MISEEGVQLILRLVALSFQYEQKIETLRLNHTFELESLGREHDDAVKESKASKESFESERRERLRVQGDLEEEIRALKESQDPEATAAMEKTIKEVDLGI